MLNKEGKVRSLRSLGKLLKSSLKSSFHLCVNCIFMASFIALSPPMELEEKLTTLKTQWSEHTGCT